MTLLVLCVLTHRLEGAALAAEVVGSPVLLVLLGRSRGIGGLGFRLRLAGISSFICICGDAKDTLQTGSV